MEDPEHGEAEGVSASLTLEQIYAHINNSLVLWSKQLTKTLDGSKVTAGGESIPEPGMGFSKTHLLIVSCALKSRLNGPNAGGNASASGLHHHYSSKNISHKGLKQMTSGSVTSTARYPPPLGVDDDDDEEEVEEEDDDDELFQSSVPEPVPVKPVVAPSKSSKAKRNKTKK